MVICPVKIQIGFVCQIRNALWISAGINAIGRIRKKRSHNLSFHHIIRRGISSLHLIVDDSVINELIHLIFQLIAPAFLPENQLISVDIRMKYRIQIDIHQIAEILVIAACHRIHGLVRVCHGVQKGIHGTLHKLDKRIF